MWQDYLHRLQRHSDRVVARLEPGDPYWPSSPSADYEDDLTPRTRRGDMHYLERLARPRSVQRRTRTHHPRFMTEYGFQSFPEMRTVEAFTEPADRTSIFTPVMLAHQKNNEATRSSTTTC